MNVGILGGTFDPIHLGHLETARLAQKHFGLDLVLFVPARLSPFKSANQASPEDRWAMTLLATWEEPSWRAVRWELEREEPSYSIDTVHEVERVLPGSNISWIIGADHLSSMLSWHRVSELFERCRVVVAPRQNLMGESLRRIATSSLLGAQVEVLPGEPIPIAATDIRQSIEDGSSISESVHPSTEEYIYRYGLYGRKGRLWIPSTLSSLG